jgi:hypothetical protein
LVSFTLGRKMAFIVAAYFSSGGCGWSILAGSATVGLANIRVKYRTIQKIQLHLSQGNHRCGEERITEGRSGMRNKGMNQENKERRKGR